MRAMDWAEASQFLLAGRRTATIATIGRDGHPHVVPVWFVLDGHDVVFSTSSASAKARNCSATSEWRFAWMMTRRHSDSSPSKGRLSSFHIRPTFSPGRRESQAAM